MTMTRSHWLRGAVALLALSTACADSKTSGPPPAEQEQVVAVTVEPSAATLDVGQSLELAALVVTTSSAAAAIPVVTWSSLDATVVAVSPMGTVVAVGPGVGRVTASAEGVVGQATVTVREPVVDPPVATIELSETALNLLVGATRQLTATVKDAAGAEIPGAAVTWTSLDGTVATVSAGGLVEAVGLGGTTVSAAAGGQAAEASVLVVPLEPVPGVVTTVELDAGALALQPGGSATLTATARDGLGAVVPGAVVLWSTLDAAVATVTQAGLVTAVGAGNTSVSASIDGKSASALVAVTEVAPPPPPPVASVELSETAPMVAEGGRRQLTATPKDALGNAITGLAIGWRTSDEGVAYVGAGGEVLAYRAGIADVTATVHGKSAVARVTVTLETPYDLFFEAFPAGGPGHVFYARDLRDPSAGSVPLMDGGTGPGRATPAPDGTRIALVVSTPGAATGQLRIVDLARTTLGAFDFPGHVDDPAWSPDGTRLAFRVHSAGSGADVWTMNADGSARLNLTADHGASNETSPSWSPALQGRLAYARTSGGASTIWTMAVDGTDKRQLTFGAADAEPAWSPDGAVIAFQRSSAGIFGDLWFVSPDGAGARSLGQIPGIQSAPAWSPDGTLLAFTSGPDVYTLRRDGGFLARRTFDLEVVGEMRPGWLLRP